MGRSNGGFAGEDATADEPPVGLGLDYATSREDFGGLLSLGGREEEYVGAAFDEVVEGDAVLVVGEEAGFRVGWLIVVVFRERWCFFGCVLADCAVWDDTMIHQGFVDWAKFVVSS